MSKSTDTEIERKFLVAALPDTLRLEVHPAEPIRQGYLAHSAGGTVRIRQKGERYFLTYKRPSAQHAAEHLELEIELTETQFNTLWPGTAGWRLEKTRYRIPYDGLIIELDVFTGNNAGHMLAEVEFESTVQADSFAPPAWLSHDVTSDDRYGNASIAQDGFPTD